MVDPSAVLDSVVKILGHIHTLTNNWCRASDAYKDFPGKVDDVRTTLNDWKKGVDERGLSWNKTLVKRLGETEVLIQTEETELQRHTQGFRAKLKMTLLPDRIGKSIDRINSALDNIRKAITDPEEISAVLDKGARARKPTLGFQRDKRYVRLQETEERVRMALTKPGDPKLVWLYGRPGSGKSCLARDVALQIESSVDMDLSQQSDRGPSSSLDPNQLEKTFDQVVYIECGPEAQISTVLLVLLQKFGKGALATDDQKAPLDSTTQSILKGLFQNQKILIILDDVSNVKIVADIIDLCGKNVKCLVTSQSADLCNRLNCNHLPILIESINSTCAKKILASHILGDQDGISGEKYSIPKHLEVLAERLIHEVDANPLALACLATGIDSQRFKDERVWQKVLDDFLDLLNSEDTAMINNFEYPHSFWVAVKQSFDRLTKEEKRLFILVSLCRGPNVPEEVVEYLYKLNRVEEFSQVFLKAKRQLENRQLIQTRGNYCSIHSLLQKFVDRILLTDKSTMELQLKEMSKSDGEKRSSKSDQEVDPDILKAIISLYFSQEVALTMGRTTDTLSPLDEGRHVLEPITRLILSDKDLPMTTHSDVRKVFLRYVESRSIHEEAAITLLRSSNSKCIVAITNVLIRFAQAANNNISVGDGVVHALQGLLRNKNLDKKVYSMSQNDLLSEVATTFLSLQQLNTMHGKNSDLNATTLFAYFTSALEDISIAMAMHDKVLTKVANPNLQNKVACVLGCFAKFGNQELCIRVSNVPSTLEELVSAFDMDTNPDFQANAAWALRGLANNGGESIVRKISGIPQSLEKLAQALTKVANPNLQNHVACILGYLARFGGKDLCIKVSNVPSTLEELVSAFDMDTNPDFQANAAWALHGLANNGGESIVGKISGIPQSLQKLAQALTKVANPNLQNHVACILGYFAKFGGKDLCIKVSNVPSTLEELVSAFDMDTNPDFQANAAWALRGLADNGGESIVGKISGIPESLEKLAQALTKVANPNLQNHVACILGYFAKFGGKDLCIKVSNVPSTLEELVSAFDMDTNPDFQANAAWALRGLANNGGESIVGKISGIPESLEKLAQALTKVANPNLQNHVACILSSLARFGGKDLCIKVSNVPSTLEELVSAFDMDTNPDFQANAAWALRGLANNGGESIVRKISGIPESLEKLVQALTKASNPKLQNQVAWLLAILAFDNNHDLCKKISDMQGLVPQLANGFESTKNIDGKFNLASQLAFFISPRCNSEPQLKLAKSPGLIESLVMLANENINSAKLNASAISIRVLTLIDPLRGQKIVLHSAHSYQQRGFAKLLLGLNKESLKDLNEASQIQPLNWDAIPENLSYRITVKARLGDLPGALADANRLIEVSRTSFHLQERGVLKCMMDDLLGALKDLDEALDLDPTDYEMLKHRGYVKFRLLNEIGARADAEKALEIKPPHVDFKHYGRDCLGVSSINYMGYQLR